MNRTDSSLSLSGCLVVDKPAGLTSHDVVARVRRILGERRVGHTGTLDPFATGVLVVLVGSATRLAQFLNLAEKEYEAVIRFGYATDTGDLTGNRRGPVIESGRTEALCSEWTASDIDRAMQTLRGEIEQVPPMYSAKKMGGRKLYELARHGKEIERAPVRVKIHQFEPLNPGAGLIGSKEPGTCDLAVRVVCSAGTYIRTLAETLGERLGSPAHLVALRRIGAGNFRLDAAVSLEQLHQLVDGGRLSDALIPPASALPELPFVHLSEQDANRVLNGAAIWLDRPPSFFREVGQQVKLLDEGGNLLGIGDYDLSSGSLRPRICLSPAK